MKFNTAYEHLTEKPVFDNSGEESPVRQSEKDNVDINKIMERFDRSGKLPVMQSRPPRYGDAKGIDYQTALMVVKEAQDAFSKLPALTRRAFDNDPQQFELFLADPANDARAVELGLKAYQQPTAEDLLKEMVKNTAPKAETDSVKK